MRPFPFVLAATALVSGAALIAAAAEGCALPGFALVIPPEAGPETGAPEGGPSNVCNRATYPDPPGGMDDGTALPTLVFALHSIDLGDMGSTPGYDLDNVCTCLYDAGPSCSGAAAQLTTYCDLPTGSGNQGIDNQAAKLFQLIELPVGQGVFGSSVFSLQANSGSWSMLIRVEGYSGMPDDPAVDVSLFPSVGLGGKMPAWDGNDVWPIAGTAVGDAGLASPRFHSNGAYVSQGKLVATMPTTQMTIHGGGLDVISIQLTAGVLTADLQQLNGQWHLKNGVIAGRWALADVFKDIASFRDNNGLPLCTNQTATYAIAKAAICQDADILVDGTQPKSAPCDALSIGLGFTADPAVLGNIVDAGALTDGCPAMYDPATDSCP